ncbi:hypothetical protein CH75_04850 [Dyella jiangningensis]|nr:hypothetical protein CH75_04850 [Dyella jiangningensis]
MSGYQVEENRRWTLYDINAFFGDSGSAIFDMQGRIVGVVSIMVPQVYGQGYMKLMGGLPLAFTKEQWTKAHG